MGITVREKEKGSGVFWVFINQNGVRKSKKIGDQSLANQVAEKINARMVLGEFDISAPKKQSKNRLTFQDAAALWMADYIERFRLPSTVERYEGTLRLHINPVLGPIPIPDITRNDIKKLLNDLFAIRSKSTVSQARDLIYNIFRYVEEDIGEDIISKNPAAGILKKVDFRRDRGKKVGDHLTHQEKERFLETAYKEFSSYYIFFLTAFQTGMRLGELIALEWGDIDFNGGFIHVQRSCRRLKDIRDTTKTGHTRKVDMTDNLMTEIKGLLIKRKKEALADGASLRPVIFHRNGKIMDQNFVRAKLSKILSTAGIRKIRFHDIRHTFAVHLLSAGISPVYVKEQLGHKSITTTVDVYGAWIKTPGDKGLVNILESSRFKEKKHPIA